MKLTSALSSQVQETFPWKKFLIFQETKLSSSNIKKFYISANETLYFFDLNPQSFSLKKLLYFFLKKPALKRIIIFSQKKAFLIFPEMKTCTFHPKLKKYKKNTPHENFSYFRKWKLQKKCLCFLKSKLYWDTETLKKLLIFQKTEAPKKRLIFQKVKSNCLVSSLEKLIILQEKLSKPENQTRSYSLALLIY